MTSARRNEILAKIHKPHGHRRWLQSLVVMAAGVLAACGRPEGTIQMPPQASTHAAEVDWLYYFVFWVSVVAFVLITATTVWFSWQFRKRPGHTSRPPGHHTALELFWTFSPLVLLAFMFHWGFQGYVSGAVAPSDSEQIRVYGQQWSWTYVYPNGGTAPGHQLVVPAAKPVKLTMTSKDVIHSFFIPAFRVKRDTVPGMFTTIWFEADEETSERYVQNGTPMECEPTSNACPDGYACRYDLTPGLEERKGYCYQAHQVFCTEYCGAPSGEGNRGHSAMYGNVHVVSQGEYEQFMELLIGPPPECDGLEGEEESVCWGGAIFASNNCAGQCHNGVAAPSLGGLWGREEMLEGIGPLTVGGEEGEEYLRESIVAPNAKRVVGYSAQMPQYGFNEAEVDALVAYLKQYTE